MLVQVIFGNLHREELVSIQGDTSNVHANIVWIAEGKGGGEIKVTMFYRPQEFDIRSIFVEEEMVMVFATHQFGNHLLATAWKGFRESGISYRIVEFVANTY